MVGNRDAGMETALLTEAERYRMRAIVSTVKGHDVELRGTATRYQRNVGVIAEGACRENRPARVLDCSFRIGTAEPNLENLTKLVKALGVSADLLLGTARP
jgi:hypothetical protein